MKRYKSSDLSRNVAEVIKEAKANGVIIECRRSNGEVEEELVLVRKREIHEGNEWLFSHVEHGDKHESK